MRIQVRNFLIKPLLALAIAVPAMMAGNVGDAEARHKHKRAAIIAGAIIGGALIYKHHKRKKYHRSHKRKSYGRYHHGHNYHKKKVRHHYKRRGHVKRHHGYRKHGYVDRSRWIK